MTTDEQLAKGIREIASEIGGTVGVAVRDIRRERALDLNADVRFPSASVIKVLIMVELLAQSEAGEIDLCEQLLLQDAEKVPGSGVLSMLHAGLPLTLEDLANLMITISDNTASNMLIDRLTCERINLRAERLGLRQTQLGRRFYDFEARDRGRDNWTSPADMANLLVSIERRQVETPAACEKMLAILRRQQLDSKIPRLLPPDTPVAHKTGSMSTASHDVGIIYSPAGPLSLAVLTRDADSGAAAEGGIRHVARLVYQHWGTG